jgi:DNA-binding transcriptional LysR family regulator
MEIRVLRTFVAVAELRHFARAASVCNLSQPAVSHQIALLEEEVGARLLNRANRRVSLTVAGEVMLEEARRILGSIDRARERLQEVARGAVGRIRLGATPTPGLYLLPAILADYRRRHPTYDVHLEVAPVHRLVERVARNELDMAVVADVPPATELRKRPIVSDPLVLIVVPGHPLASRRRVTPSRLASECWLVREEGSDTRKAQVNWWRQARIQPARTMAFDGPDGVKRAAFAGLGIALTSALTVDDELDQGRLARVNVTGMLPKRTLVLVDHPQKHHGAACRAMLALIDERFP